MLTQMRALYAREVIEDGFCVNQTALKINMEARNNYYLEKKAGMRGRTSITDSPSKE